ncbi:unnamed protein product [Blepharisma stoltei]|uniref:Dickkopf N-terminal cysteine-rich domain-containing protein n=1 Tax=Blepharisma stoltei TaxID=1481888 RepID=A0AAU9JIC6_9CILI|nr:unnamed protein product [Blepharisma stoltei]
MDFKFRAFLLLHFMLFYLPIASSNPCPSYICKPSSMAFAADTCLYYTNEALTYYARECSGNKLCKYATGSNNKTCEDETLSFGHSWVGEKCKTNKDCFKGVSSGCVDGTCQGTPMGQSCTSIYQCYPGNSCINKQCIPLIEIGQKGCSSDFDCVNNGACNVTSGNPQTNTCYEVFSFEPHSPVGDCNNNQSMLCKYTTCALNKADYNYYCTEMLVSDPEPASLCDVNQNRCPAKPDNFFNPPYVANQYCACGYNSEGNSYCNLFLGDGPGLSLLSIRAKWYSSEAILKCNTGRREEFNCIKDYWDEKNFKAYYYWTTYFQEYNYIIGSEKCVLNTADSSYVYAKKLYDGEAGDSGDSDENSSGGILGISLLIGIFLH